jgi:hypothetical protein
MISKPIKKNNNFALWYLFENVSTRIDWLRKPSKKQGFRIMFYTALLSSLQGLRKNFDRVFVSFLRGYRNVKGLSMIFSQMLLTGFHIEITQVIQSDIGSDGMRYRTDRNLPKIR